MLNDFLQKFEVLLILDQKSNLLLDFNDQPKTLIISGV